MKKLIIIFLISFIFTPVVLSAPNYDPNHKTCIYDTSYNIELRNRLEKEYDKKCWRKISPTHFENICGVNSYYYMVQNPYNLQKIDTYKTTCK